jgi:hypothetical protein
MYQFDICNNFIYFDNFDYLNKSQVDVNMGYWQGIQDFPSSQFFLISVAKSYGEIFWSLQA